MRLLFDIDSREMRTVKISDKYNIELRKIYEQIDKLKTNRVYELSGVRSDGSVATIGQSLENQIRELVIKIDNSQPGFEDEIVAAIERAGI